MTFLGVLKNIGLGILYGAGKVAQFAQPFEPAMSILFPGSGSLFSAFTNAVVMAEHMLPAEGNGAAKKVAVHAVMSATVPGIDPGKLSEAIDQFVAAMNSLEKAMQPGPPA